jgi:hypothetical protein
MILSLGDASAAIHEVLAAYDAYLSPELKLAVASKPVGEIFVFCDPATYAAKFDVTWYCVFKKAINSLNSDYSSKVVPGFCSSEKDRTARKIYLQSGVCDNPCTYHHEFIHWLTHPDFYPVYYTVGGHAPFQVEGITEYATRSISQTIAQTRKGKYENNYLKTKSWIDHSPGRRDTALQLMFQGIGGGGKDISQAAAAAALSGLLP